MKNILKTSVLSFLLSSIFFNGIITSQNIQKNDLEQMNLYVNVKTLRENIHTAHQNALGQIKPFLGRESSYYDFNINGNLHEESKYKGNFSLRYKNTYKYDNKGNQVEKTSYNSDGGLYYKVVRRYNDKGNLIEANVHGYSFFYKDSKNTYKYDGKGNQVEKTSYNSDGTLSKKWTYKYDGKGNQVEETSYNSDENLAYKYTYEYDGKGNQVERSTYDSDESLTFIGIYKHDEKGNQVERSNYNGDYSLTSKVTYKYEFDKNNNWIKRITYDDKGVALEITERVIEYY